MKTNPVLENSRVRFSFDGKSGALISVTDLSADREYPIRTSAFYLETEGKTLFATSVPTACEATERSLCFSYTDGAVRATVTYELKENAAYVEKEIAFSSDAALSVDKVGAETLSFAEIPAAILFHDDQTLWHVPTNYFVRYPEGGLYFGLEYPYWIHSADKNSISMAYTPAVTLPAGETFVSERTFLGVYRMENVLRVSHGAYPSTEHPFRYYDIFAGTGLNQHFRGNKIPEDAGMPEEVLDWGEVYAMQEFVRDFLPKEPLPEDGFWLWQNGWWAKLFSPDLAAIEPLRRAEVHDLMTAAIFFGHDKHPTTEPKYVRDARIEPLGFPIYRGETAGVHEGTTGWHEEVKTEKSDDIVGYSDHFRAPADYEEFIKESARRGVRISSFCTPNITYKNRPEWVSVNKEGQNAQYFGTRMSCPACDDFMNFHYKVTTDILDSYPSTMWMYDGRWLNYREVAGYHFGYIGEEPCYAENHGHRPGEGRYQEWKNIEKFKAKLRARYPRLAMEEYYGLKRGGIWSLRSFNADENIYEMGSTENNRFQTWHNECGRFRPVYMNYTSIFGNTPETFAFDCISAISTAAYAQVSRGYNALRDYPETAETLKKWKKFADENYEYLTDRRNLFGQPGEYPIDGSAHIKNDAGLIFLFTAPGEEAITAKIPFCRWIGLSERQGAAYRVSFVDAQNAKGENAEVKILNETLGYGDDLYVTVTPSTAAVLHVEPTNEAPRVDFSAPETAVDAFPVRGSVLDFAE